jgi:hypothetical protein
LFGHVINRNLVAQALDGLEASRVRVRVANPPWSPTHPPALFVWCPNWRVVVMCLDMSPSEDYPIFDLPGDS